MKKILDRIVNKLIAILSDYKNQREVESYVEGIRASYEKLVNKTELTKEQEKEIQGFYTKLLGHPVPLDWHRYFTARTGGDSKYYLPTSEYKINIVGRLNVYPLKRAYTDKNISDLILPKEIQPKIYLKNMNGYFYFDQQAVSREEALHLCQNIGNVIIKPSLTARGKGVKRIVVKDGKVVSDNILLSQVFDDYKTDYLIEELICQHPDMASLNHSSLNTIRIMTYRSDMEIVVLYTVIRIGRKGQVIDNESAGGISTVINSDGTLGRFAYGAPGIDKIEYTDSNLKLDGFRIPSYNQAIEMVKKCHLQLPFFDLIAWDIAIRENGSPVLIEFNMTPDLSQSANGPAFGDYTEEILSKAMRKNNTYSELGKKMLWKRL